MKCLEEFEKKNEEFFFCLFSSYYLFIQPLAQQWYLFCDVSFC